jgi:hypothetical protein
MDVNNATVRADHVRLTSEDKDSRYGVLVLSTKTKYREGDE